ncbi:MAG TPA: AIR synthase related protein [Nakamurella sp.]
MVAAPTAAEVDELAHHLRTHPALLAKREIGLVSEVLGAASWVHGPGDDGAVVDLADTGETGPPGARQVVVCGEALLPAFVAADPYGAGVAAVLTNVNDLAAMGATPIAVLDTIVGTTELAREVLRGMTDACDWYDVRLIGGHLTVHQGAPALSAFGVGRAGAVLSLTNVEAGQSLVVAACTAGEMRTDFPFFRSFAERGRELAGDVRVLATVAASGACVAAKDISMAGLVGSLAMLLEWSGLGVTLDLDAVPRPASVPMRDWLTCFPAFGFLLCCPPGRADETVAAFHRRGLDAAVAGKIDASGVLAVRWGGWRADVLELATTGITGLLR